MGLPFSLTHIYFVFCVCRSMHEIFLSQIERDIERKGKKLRLKDAAEY
jgi:hypothetical protein